MWRIIPYGVNVTTPRRLIVGAFSSNGSYLTSTTTTTVTTLRCSSSSQRETDPNLPPHDEVTTVESREQESSTSFQPQQQRQQQQQQQQQQQPRQQQQQQRQQLEGPAMDTVKSLFRSQPPVNWKSGHQDQVNTYNIIRKHNPGQGPPRERDQPNDRFVPRGYEHNPGTGGPRFNNRKGQNNNYNNNNNNYHNNNRNHGRHGNDNRKSSYQDKNNRIGSVGVPSMNSVRTGPPMDSSQRLGIMIEKLREQRKQETPDTSTNATPSQIVPTGFQQGREDDDKTPQQPPVHVPFFLTRISRHDRPVPNYPPSRGGWSKGSREETTSDPTMSRFGFRMSERNVDSGRFTNSNVPRETHRRSTATNTIREDMEFLEGRVKRDSTMEQSERHNTKVIVPQQKRVVTLPVTAGLNLVETSNLFRVKVDDLLKKLESIGIATAGTDEKDILLDIDNLEILALEFDIETIRGEEEVFLDSQDLLMQQRRADDAVVYPPRPPVVCIMGHVDHGKTTLMDALRRRSAEQQEPKSNKKKGGKKGDTKSSSTTNVAGTEAGGITQRISAFQVDVEGQDNKVTFLDTPGHAAFKAMRQSGSHAADVIVLVVAADDGVSEQTIEILDFYKSIVKGSNGGITMVVALNKIDKPGIEVTEAKHRIENQLLQQGIICEGMGGESEFGPPVQIVPTSGLTGAGLDDLIEGLILQSEVMDLRADHEAHAEGIVMDARMEKGHGVVADCIIRWGSIKKGDYIVSGTQASRVRMVRDVNDRIVERGIPSQPVRLVGFKSLPTAGDPIICAGSEKAAEEMVEQMRGNADDGREDRAATTNDVEIHIGGMRRHDTRRVAKFHDLAGLEDSDGTIRIPIIVKADARGSLSAVRDSLVSLGERSTHKVLVDPIQEGVGEITSSDIHMAKESNACIFSFGLKKHDQAVMNLAESEGVIIRNNDIIYALLDEAKEILGRYLPARPHEQSHGTASIQAIFEVDGELGKEKVAGLKVMEGNLYRSKDPKRIPTHFRVYRNGQLISPEGESVTASSLRSFKKLVEDVRMGDECGLVLSGFDDFQQGDEVECYSIEMKTSSL